MTPEVEKKIQRNLKILTEEHGQLRSIEEKLPIDHDGAPVPWYTYPAIEQLRQYDFSTCSIFEYGCGNSSLWWASRSAIVTSVEHNLEWMNRIAEKAPGNLRLIHHPEKEDYVACIRKAAGPFDVIIIDGRWRLACAGEALAHLKPGGLIVFDNSDWYAEAPQALTGQGFVRFDYSGFGPVNNYCWSTSLFCRADLRLARHSPGPGPVGGLQSCGDHCD